MTVEFLPLRGGLEIPDSEGTPFSECGYLLSAEH